MVWSLKKILSCWRKVFRSSKEEDGDDNVLPEGRIRVCVAGRRSPPQKFELEANFLNHPLFEDLLQLSVEEFGYSYTGALRIACEVEFFLHLLHLLRSSDPIVHYMELRDVIAKFPVKYIS